MAIGKAWETRLKIVVASQVKLGQRGSEIEGRIIVILYYVIMFAMSKILLLLLISCSMPSAGSATAFIKLPYFLDAFAL